jgi:hypothetical protein
MHRSDFSPRAGAFLLDPAIKACRAVPPLGVADADLTIRIGCRYSVGAAGGSEGAVGPHFYGATA